jgi:hypothetical protein
MSVAVNFEDQDKVAVAVAAVLQEGKWPIYSEFTLHGLVEEEYFELVVAVLRKMEA